jgi:hypothetical protein
VLWASGQRATGEGETQVEAADANYGRMARTDEGLLVCGLKETRQGYFSGLTGRRSCMLHPPRGAAREVLPRGRKGRRAFEDVVVRGASLVASSGEAVAVYSLSAGRRIGAARTVGARPTLRLLGSAVAIGGSVRSGPAALLSTPSGVVHVRLLDHGRGWRVWSQAVSWKDGAVSLGPPTSTPVPAPLSDIVHRLQLVGGGLDGRRFLFARDAQGRFRIVEMAGRPAEAIIRWSGRAPRFSDGGATATAENGLIGLGATGSDEHTALVIDLGQGAPVAARAPLDRPCLRGLPRPGVSAVEHRPLHQRAQGAGGGDGVAGPHGPVLDDSGRRSPAAGRRLTAGAETVNRAGGARARPGSRQSSRLRFTRASMSPISLRPPTPRARSTPTTRGPAPDPTAR